MNDLLVMFLSGAMGGFYFAKSLGPRRPEPEPLDDLSFAAVLVIGLEGLVMFIAVSHLMYWEIIAAL